ncbi:hypothetical protein [Massilia agilis]
MLPPARLVPQSVPLVAVPPAPLLAPLVLLVPLVLSVQLAPPLVPLVPLVPPLVSLPLVPASLPRPPSPACRLAPSLRSVLASLRLLLLQATTATAPRLTTNLANGALAPSQKENRPHLRPIFFGFALILRSSAFPVQEKENMNRRSGECRNPC